MLFYNSALLARRFVAASCSGGAHGARKCALSSSSSSSSSSWSEEERQRGRREAPPALPETEDPFLILNVKIDATEAEIKTSFYQLAKLVHPDAAPRRTDALKAAADFHKLVRAYETLTDPTKRAEYILKRRPHHYSHIGTSASAAAAAAAGFNNYNSKVSNPVDAFNASLRKGRRRSTRRRAGMYDAIFEGEDEDEGEEEGEGRRRGAAAAAAAAAGGKGGWDALSLLDPGLFGQLQESFQDAMIHAYLGPRVAENTIPWAFEGEERRSRGRAEGGREEGEEGEEEGLHPHILELTSGQQLLGYVDVAPLSLDSLLEAGRNEDEEKEEGAEGGEEEELSLRWQLSGLASVTDRKNYMPLRLVWQGRCLARSTRLRDPVKEEDVLVVQTHLEIDAQQEQQQQQQQQEQQGKCYVIRGLESKRLLSSHQVRDAATGELTHVLVSHRTPLVSHLHLLQAEGGVECRASKGDLQSYVPSEYWRFPPRSQDHDVGSWYIERADPTAPGRNGGRSVAATRKEKVLPPAVMVLVCAFKTLDKEVREEEKRQRSARLKETVKGWMGKIL